VAMDDVRLTWRRVNSRAMLSQPARIPGMSTSGAVSEDGSLLVPDVGLDLGD
jgi:hypothetical protein